MYEMQVKIKVGNNPCNQKQWVSIRPTGGSPYQYQTEADAQRMLNICYPDVLNEEKRVIQVEP